MGSVKKTGANLRSIYSKTPRKLAPEDRTYRAIS